MKTIFTILFTALLVSNLTGQIKQELDSIIGEEYYGAWEFYSKYHHIYDEDEREVERIYLSDDWYTGQLTEYRTEYTYNAQNEITLEISSSRPYGTMQWTFEEKREYAFDLNGNLVEDSYAYWDTGTMQWVLSQKIERTYDANGNLVLLSSLFWWSSLNQWVLSSKDEFTYNINNNLLTKIYSFWDNNNMQWNLSSKEESTYDTNGNRVSRIDFNWNDNTSQWVFDYNNEFTYDADNRLLTYISSFWGGTQWVNETKDDYTYDVNGNIASWIFSSWYDSQWNYDSKFEYVYDANDNEILVTDFLWDNYTMQWTSNWRETSTYDNDYAYNELILPNDPYGNEYTEDKFRYKKLNIIGEQWESGSQQWILWYRNTYYYSEQLVNTQNIADSNVRIFPNPARDKVVFDLAATSKPINVKLYDAQGKLASIQRLKNNTISVEHLDTGVYFYQFFYDGQQEGGRLIIR